MSNAGLTMAAAALVSLASGCVASLGKVEAPDETTKTFTAGLGERINVSNAFVTPLSVLEDSRCPADVQCIQAGTVRISIRIEQADRAGTQEIGLEAPYDMGGQWLHLTGVCPYPRHAGPTSKTGPRFTFFINQSSSSRPPSASC